MPGTKTDASAAGADSLSTSYERHLTTIVRYLRRRLGDDEAEDAAGEVFLRALKGGTHDPSLPFLYGVAANVIAERRRAERRRLRAMQAAARAHEPETQPALIEPVSADLVTALRGLKRIDRECLLLIAWGELSYEEVAQALNVPIGTVRSRMARARRQLHLTAARSRAPRDVRAKEPR